MPYAPPRERRERREPSVERFCYQERVEECMVHDDRTELKAESQEQQAMTLDEMIKEMENVKIDEEKVSKEKEVVKTKVFTQSLVLDCLKSWLNEIIGSDIVCLQEEVSKEELQHMLPLTVETIFEFSRQVVQLPSLSGDDDEKGKFLLTVKTLSDDKSISFKVRESYRIDQIKEIIEDKQGLKKDLQRLYCGNKMMEDTKTLKDYNIENASIINLILLRRGLNCPTYYINPALFDPGFNFSFIGVEDKEKTFYRGGREYVRPLGSQRYALKVLGKHTTDLWLGSTGKFTGSEGEWPVAYHGTSEANALNIAECGFDLSKCKRFLYGRGIYSTPCPKTAKLYAPQYTFEGNQCKLIFQVRVDPEKLVVGKPNNRDGEYWILPDGDFMRPYGICVFPID